LRERIIWYIPSLMRRPNLKPTFTKVANAAIFGTVVALVTAEAAPPDAAALLSATGGWIGYQTGAFLESRLG